MEKINMMNGRNALTMEQRQKLTIFHAAQQAEKSTKKSHRRVWQHIGVGTPAAEKRGHAPSDGACITDSAAVAIDFAAGLYAVKAAKIAASRSANPRLLDIVSQYADILRLRNFLENGDIDAPFQVLEEHTRYDGGIPVQSLELEETQEAKMAMLSRLELVVGRELADLKQAAALQLVELAAAGRLCNFDDLHSIATQKAVYPVLYAIIDGNRGRMAHWAESLDAVNDDGEGGTIAHDVPDAHATGEMSRREMELIIEEVAATHGEKMRTFWNWKKAGFTLEEIAAFMGASLSACKRLSLKLQELVRAALLDI